MILLGFPFGRVPAIQSVETFAELQTIFDLPTQYALRRVDLNCLLTERCGEGW